MQTRTQLLQLEMLAVAAGATDLWEVALVPNTAYGHPFTVVVPARASDAAEQMHCKSTQVHALARRVNSPGTNPRGQD